MFAFGYSDFGDCQKGESGWQMTFAQGDPHRIARELGIEVIPLAFKKQRGAYKVLMRNRFYLHKRRSAPCNGAYRNAARDRTRRIYIEKKRSRLAASRNLTFSICGKAGWNTKQTSLLPKSPCLMMKILEYIENGYDIQQIARAMHSDIYLVALENGYADRTGLSFPSSGIPQSIFEIDNWRV